MEEEPSSPPVSAVRLETAWVGDLLLVRMLVLVGVGLVLPLGGGGRRKACCTEREANRQIVARRTAARLPAVCSEGGGGRGRLLLMIIVAVLVLRGPWNAGHRAYVRVDDGVRIDDVLACFGTLIGHRKRRGRAGTLSWIMPVRDEEG